MTGCGIDESLSESVTMRRASNSACSSACNSALYSSKYNLRMKHDHNYLKLQWRIIVIIRNHLKEFLRFCVCWLCVWIRNFKSLYSGPFDLRNKSLSGVGWEPICIASRGHSNDYDTTDIIFFRHTDLSAPHFLVKLLCRRPSPFRKTHEIKINMWSDPIEIQ